MSEVPSPANGGQGPGLFWNVPNPYGYAASVDAAATVAAPLLAGFSTALIGLLLTADGSIRLRDPALAPLVVAALLLLACVQCAVWARQYTVTPSQVLEWWPDLAAGDAAVAQRREERRREQWRYVELAGRWQDRSRHTYHWGIAALLLGLGLVLVPPAGDRGWQWLAAGLAFLGLLGEVYWIVAPNRRSWPLTPRLFPEPVDVMNLPSVQPGPYSGPPPPPG